MKPKLRLLFLLGVIGWLPDALAQADKYKPGDKIEYKEPRYSDNWEPGVYVGATPEGKQPIIRRKPSQFFPEGAETAYDWESIRPLTARPPTKAPDAPAKAGGVAPPPVPQKPTPPAAPATGTPAVADGGLLTKEDVLNFLQARLGENPFAHPQREQIRKELAEMIKRRGVDFRYEAVSDFSNQLGKYGASSDITFPLSANFGPPTKQPWLMGRWNLSKIGATVDYRGTDGYIYRQGEIGVKDVGNVTITPDGGYIWNIDVPRGVARGQWRNATAEEMPYQGGDAIVLLKAKGGVDWIVHQDRVTTLKGDWVNIAQLGSRGIREGGFRDVKAK